MGSSRESWVCMSAEPSGPDVEGGNGSVTRTGVMAATSESSGAGGTKSVVAGRPFAGNDSVELTVGTDEAAREPHEEIASIVSKTMFTRGYCAEDAFRWFEGETRRATHP